MAIITREDKGSALTHTELDNNMEQIPNGANSSIVDDGTNVSITASTLSVNGHTDLHDTSITRLRVTGESTLSGLTANTLNVDAHTDLHDTSITRLRVTGDSTLSGLTANTLSVDGNSTLAGVTTTTLTATNTTTLNGVTANALSVANYTALHNTSATGLTVTGDTTLHNASVLNLEINSNLFVDDNAYFYKNVIISDLTVGDSTTLNTLNVTGNSTLSSPTLTGLTNASMLTVTGNTTLQSFTSTSTATLNNVNIAGNVDIDGATYVDQFYVGEFANITGTLTVDGNVSVCNSSTFTSSNTNLGSTTNPNLVTIQGNDLPSDSGSAKSALVIKQDTGDNTTKLKFKTVRTSTGTSWNTCGVRIETSVDSTQMGYMQFNGNNNNYGISWGTQNNEKMRMTSGGAFLIGTTTFQRAYNGNSLAYSPDSNGLVSSVGTTDTCYHNLFYNPNGFVGGVRTTGTSTQYVTGSDYRLKENVTSISNATERFMQLKPVNFNFIADKDTRVDGFIAHELDEVVSEAVAGEKDGEDMQGIDMSKIIPLLTKTLQEALMRIEELEKKC